MSLTREQAVVEQRNLAKVANFADSIIRVPFTRIGVGADSAVGVVPLVGDIIGLFIFFYVFAKARALGLPGKSVAMLIGYAALDAAICVVPVAGDVADVFSRPSRHALRLVTNHLRGTHQITDEVHIDKPWLDEFLDARAGSRFWSNSTVRWTVLHLPDMICLALIVVFINTIIQLAGVVAAWLTHPHF
jgi:hypothetical protein